MMISRCQAIKIDHPYLSDRSRYFRPPVLGFIHNEFYPESNGNDFKGLTKVVSEEGILPYLGDDKLLFIAVKEPIEEKVKRLPKLNGAQTVIVPVRDGQLRVLLKRLECYS